MFQQPRYNMPSTVASYPSSQHHPTQSRPNASLDLSHLPPLQHEAAYEYDSFLQQLTFNSKEVITSLTRIAGENLQAAQAISTVIEQRSFHAPPNAKLPFLYLIDSVVKNIGANYISCFAVNLFHTFTNAYAVVPPQVRMSMHRLLNTWPPYFGMEVVTTMRRNITEQDAMGPPPPVQHHPSTGQSLRIPPQVQQQSQQYPYSNQGNRMLNQVQPPPQQVLQNMGMQPHHQHSQPLPAHHGSAALSQPLSISSQPMIPRLTSQLQPRKAPVQPNQANPVAPPPSSEFIQIENMMQDITRKASSGIHPPNHQLFTINRLITTQLSLPVAPYYRNMLLQHQQRLRNISSVPRISMSAPVPSSRLPSNPVPSTQIAPVTVPNPQMNPIPPPVPSALTGLLRSMPQGVLPKPPQPVSHPIPSATAVPSHPMNNHVQQSYSAPSYPPSPQVPSTEFKSSLPTTLKFADLKTMSHASVVRSLYTDLPHLSKSDGMRFATKEALRDHLDWLFQQNRRKRARPESTAVGGRSRCWFDSLAVFLGKENGNGNSTNGIGNVNESLANNGNANKEDNNESKIQMVEARGESELCQACHEGFESVWDDEKQSWMLKDAIRTEDDDIYHTNCIEVNDVNASSDYEQIETALNDTQSEAVSDQVPENYLDSPSLKRKREEDALAEGHLQSTKVEQVEMKSTTPPEKRLRVDIPTEKYNLDYVVSAQNFISYPVAKTETTGIKEEPVTQNQTKHNISAKSESTLVNPSTTNETK